jgi:outer membrane protein TolC
MIITQKQIKALGAAEPFTIETPEDTLRRRLLRDQHLPFSAPASLGSSDLDQVPYWPDVRRGTGGDGSEPAPAVSGPLLLTLAQALQVGARSSRDYQSEKEKVFRAALALDLERDAFRHTFTGLLGATLSSDQSGEEEVSGVEGSAELGWSRRFRSGAELTSRIAVDLVKLLTLDKASAFGILADASLSIPLLRGAGSHIVAEPLTQAERDMVYAIWTFERYKRTFAVQVAREYFRVLQQWDQLDNVEANYRSVVVSARRTRRMAEVGELPEFQVGQALQEELRARTRWVQTRQTYANQLDAFKVLLGLPADADVGLDEGAIVKLEETLGGLMAQSAPAQEEQGAVAADAPVELREPRPEEAGPLGMPESEALRIAFDHRLDLRVAEGRVVDAQRAVVVAADALRADLTLGGSAQVGESRTLGSADAGDGRLEFDKGRYSAALDLDLPFERTAERNRYRESLIGLEEAVRSFQQQEDAVKTDIRSGLRNILQSREELRIQAQAVDLAEDRVTSSSLFLEEGRAQVRDLLDAQNDLLEAQIAMTAALVDYRLGELELQRDMGVLGLDEEGLWEEHVPGGLEQGDE